MKMAVSWDHHPEDGSRNLFRNVGQYLPDYTVLSNVVVE
jgi:hypothetical protein